jgi:adenine/guanine phosphoribosyltransferase-like PRPP-binding protein
VETQVRELKYRMMTVNQLKIAAQTHTYQELSNTLGLSPPIISRYIKGHVLPSLGRSRSIHEKLAEITSPAEELRRRLVLDEEGYFDNTPIVSEIAWLKTIANHAVERLAGRRVTKVLTAAVDGVPVASLVANLLEVDLVIAKSTREVGITDFAEESFTQGASAVRRSLYVPKRSIGRRDSFVIIDDVVRTGNTVKALVDLVTGQRADIAGVYVIVAVGDVWRVVLGRIIDRYSFDTFIEM